MSFTMLFFPAMAALLVLAVVLLVQGFRRKDLKKQFAALLILAFVAVCAQALMKFITRPL